MNYKHYLFIEFEGWMETDLSGFKNVEVLFESPDGTVFRKCTYDSGNSVCVKSIPDSICTEILNR
jgi:hypothetical protein